MKHVISILLMLLAGMMPVGACVKKTVASKPLTLIVTDTTQALLPEVEVRVGKAVYRTSWDGRVVLPPDVLTVARTAKISREGYKTVKMRLAPDSATVIVPLVAVPSATKKNAVYFLTTSARTDGAEEVRMATMGAKTGSNHVEAGRLTAGEVNDFAKWYFWPTMADSTHRKSADKWQIRPRRRYTVQVVNEDGYPIAAQTVSLLDRKGNTLFQAVTDNTGKAELWAGLLTYGQPTDDKGLQVEVNSRCVPAHTWQTVVVEEACGDRSSSDADASQADVVFVFDATGSMGDELRYLQAEMKDVIRRASESTGGLTIRTGAVVYRDHSDEYVTRLSRLTGDITVTQTFIDKQQAGGGGDYEEAVPEALMAALNSAGWDEQARARIAFLILDAPCHGDSATLALLHEQILNAAALGVRIVPVVCSGIGKDGEYLVRAMALATNGTTFFLTDDSGIGAPHLQPTTDSLAVEHLNDMLVRTIVEYSYMPDCQSADVPPSMTDERYLPNPYEAEDGTETAFPHGDGYLYLLDISGKLLTVVEGDWNTFTAEHEVITRLHLPVGVYFVKVYTGREWITKKIFVR